MSIDSILYKESFVRHTPFWKEGMSGVRVGMAGETADYSMAADDNVAIGLLICVVISLVVIARSQKFMGFQLKTLFRTPRANSFEMRETLDEMRYQAFFWAQGMVMYSVLAYMTAKEYVATDYRIDDYVLMALFLGVVATYFLVRGLLGQVVNHVFFHRSDVRLVSISRIFLIAVQGALMLPVIAVSIYCHASVENTLYIAIGIHIVTILLLIYKVYNIFFRKNSRILQFFLYLCTLEAVPFTLFIGTLAYIAYFLKII